MLAAADTAELVLTDRELTRIIELVYKRSGITLHDGKRALIVGRLQKRVRLGGFRRFEDYLEYVDSERSGEELTALLDAITTNHTSFFREPQHFTFLSEVVLPALVQRGGTIEGWTAACSTGEEPYTIAMTALERLGSDTPRRMRLLASDLSTKALSTARKGIYKAERVDGVAMPLLKRYFEKGAGAQAGLVRVKPVLQQFLDFQQMNLLQLPPMAREFDFIFCRNVMIYFDLAVRQRVVSGLERFIRPGGYLFISHSESLNGVSHRLRSVAPAVFRRDV